MSLQFTDLGEPSMNNVASNSVFYDPLPPFVTHFSLNRNRNYVLPYKRPLQDSKLLAPVM